MPQITIQQAKRLANEHHRAGRFAQAIEIYRQLLAIDPNLRLYNALGDALLSTNQTDAAISVLSEGTRVHPEDSFVFSNLGCAYQLAGRIDQAIAANRRAVQLDPSSYEALSNLAIALRTRWQLDEAVEFARRAVEIAPTSSDALRILGNILLAQERLDEAEPAIRRAIELSPTDPLNFTDLGILFQHRNQFDLAIETFGRALALQPAYAAAHYDLGRVLFELGNIEAALEHFQTAARLKPSFVAAPSAVLMALNYRTVDRAMYMDAHRRWEEHYAKPLFSLRAPHDNDGRPDRRLRVGYLSADFRSHSVNYFFAPLLGTHDRAVVETYCYSNVASPDATTAELQQIAHHWRDVSGLADNELVHRIRDDRIDILVDLSLHTGGSRLAALAARPAPVQINYLGYAATAGLSYIDYRLTDLTLDPPGLTEHWNTETLVRLPGGFCAYRPPTEAPEIVDRPAGDEIVFGSFNSLAKLSDEIFLIWCDILAEIPRSRLLIQARGANQPSVRERLYRLLSTKDIESDRLILQGWRSLTEYLRMLGSLDIALDSFPFNGHTTSCHVLWMGVPVVTLSGSTSISRVGLSLLTMLGLEDLATSDADGYVRSAVALARSPERRADLRRTLRTRMRNSPLLDSLRLAREIEAAYREMWVRWCSNNGT